MKDKPVKKYRVSCLSFTVLVEVDQFHRIIGGAPLINKFRGQDFDKLIRWIQNKNMECEIDEI